MQKKKKKGLHNSHRQWTKFDHILCVAFFGTYLIYSSFASQKKNFWKLENLWCLVQKKDFLIGDLLGQLVVYWDII